MPLLKIPAHVRIRGVWLTRSEYLQQLRDSRRGRPCAFPSCPSLAAADGMQRFCTKHRGRVVRNGSPIIPRWPARDVLAFADTTTLPFIRAAMLPVESRKRPHGYRSVEWTVRASLLGPVLAEACELTELHLQRSFLHAQKLAEVLQKVPAKLAALASCYSIPSERLVSIAAAALIHGRHFLAVEPRVDQTATGMPSLAVDSTPLALAVGRAALASIRRASATPRAARLHVGRTILALSRDAVLKVAASYVAAPRGIEAEQAALGGTPKRLNPAFTPQALRAAVQREKARSYIAERRRDAGYVRRERQRRQELAAGAEPRTERSRRTRARDKALASMGREQLADSLRSLLDRR